MGRHVVPAYAAYSSGMLATSSAGCFLVIDQAVPTSETNGDSTLCSVHSRVACRYSFPDHFADSHALEPPSHTCCNSLRNVVLDFPTLELSVSTVARTRKVPLRERIRCEVSSPVVHLPASSFSWYHTGTRKAIRHCLSPYYYEPSATGVHPNDNGFLGLIQVCTLLRVHTRTQNKRSIRHVVCDCSLSGLVRYCERWPFNLLGVDSSFAPCRNHCNHEMQLGPGSAK